MALMFPRLARNFVKNGYFPTDVETLKRVSAHLACGPDQSGVFRLLDPCCGEGAALLQLTETLKAENPEAAAVGIETWGLEFDRERAWHAKSVLGRVVHSDVQDVVVKARSMSLLFLNPPYGFGLKDDEGQAAGGDGAQKAERLERMFLKKTAPYLAPDGILIYIVPYYALDDEIRTYLARNFTDLVFYMAPEQQFRQCVVMGRKVKRSSYPPKAVLDMLAHAQAGELKERVLPEESELGFGRYEVPAIGRGAPFDFHAVRLDGEQLSDELGHWRKATLWPGFETTFNQVKTEARRPLRQMSQWHLALALAAGQVTGQVRSKSGRIFLIKGDTFKKKERQVATSVDDDGNVSETITLVDRFVPVINGIEFTPGERLGEIVKIS